MGINQKVSDLYEQLHAVQASKNLLIHRLSIRDIDRSTIIARYVETECELIDAIAEEGFSELESLV